MFLPKPVLLKKLHKILEEDLGQGDITTHSLIPKDWNAEGKVVAKEEGIVAGIHTVSVLCESLGLVTEILKHDGERVESGSVLLSIRGNAQSLISAERTILNILSRMSGIATLTDRLVKKLRTAGLQTRVACTRKVAPGLGFLDKKAVLMGHGDTHRLHLDDMVLIKDNHLRVVGGVEEAIRRVKESISFAKKIEVEVTSSEDALKAARVGADVVMLDNFSPPQINKTLVIMIKENVRNRVLVEASGGITARNILQYARTGVDIVSVGEVTHSVKSLDISLEVTGVEELG
ncbi:MAG: carboxylating nicotinate-nucleotide diphosphorylase [Candidatus Bathyarchaeota archaeon]|nr:MAG: carboxylating nicotinate-nucleotide diphosphorylase [Candidatus Bathyarchaeota archaeon]